MYGTGEPVASVMSPEDCCILLGSVPVGRVAFVVDGLPEVLPVNFSLVGNDIAIRTAAKSRLARLAGAGETLTFEVDELHRPWIGGDRHTVVVMSPTRVTGRRIGLA